MIDQRDLSITKQVRLFAVRLPDIVCYIISRHVMKFGLLTAFSVLPTVLTSVIEASDKDLDKYLSKGIPTLLDIYATWCGHCSRFSPVFDELAGKYEETDKVQFIKLDGDKNRKAASKFNVQYFPTIKWLSGKAGEAEDVDSREIDDLVALIENKAKISPGGKPVKAAPPLAHEPSIIELDDDSFEDAVDNKAALVAFTTTWCGHCKRLKPEWAELSKIYARDDDVAVVNVDCTNSGAEALMGTFHVQGFPTIVYFPKDGSTPKPYMGGRTIQDFVGFLRAEGASHRLPNGALDESAGVDESIGRLDDAASNAVDLLSVSDGVYKRILQKVADQGIGYIEKEISRVSKLLGSYSLSGEKFDGLSIRLNVLSALKPLSDGIGEEGAKDEL